MGIEQSSLSKISLFYCGRGAGVHVKFLIYKDSLKRLHCGVNFMLLLGRHSFHLMIINAGLNKLHISTSVLFEEKGWYLFAHFHVIS